LSNTILDFNEIRQQSIGKWVGIYQQLGISVGDGRHCPCPICGGKDRFRMDDKEGRGTWICNQCGAGDGFNLVEKVLSVDVKGAFEAVEKILGIVPKNPITQEKKATPEEFKALLKKSSKVRKGDPVYKYLKGRGLQMDEIPGQIYYTAHAYDYETKKEQDAMLAIFRDPKGEGLTIHRTFIKDGKKMDIKSPRKIMSPVDGKKMNGGAVRLYDGKPEVLGVCEGIETAIAVHEMYGVVIWPCLNANMLEAWEPPDFINTVRIYSDNDWHYVGQSAAYNLARRLSLQPYELKVTVHLPKMKDFLDDLNMGIK
jgi:putative DNA primase/helicase